LVFARNNPGLASEMNNLKICVTIPEIAKLEKIIRLKNFLLKKNKIIDKTTEKIPSPINVTPIKNTFKKLEWYGFNKINPSGFE
jgi:hypothetical protein